MVEEEEEEEEEEEHDTQVEWISRPIGSKSLYGEVTQSSKVQ